MILRRVQTPPAPRRSVISAEYELRAMEEARLRRVFEDAELYAKLMSRDCARPPLPAGWLPARIG